MEGFNNHILFMLAIVVLSVILSTPDPVSAETSQMSDSVTESFAHGASIDVNLAVGTVNGSAQKFEVRFEPYVDGRLTYGFDFRAEGRVHADAFDRISPGKASQDEISYASKNLQVGDRVEIGLRDLYVQRYFDNVFIRAGKQQIVWGKADGLKVLDVIDPQDFSEFILPDFEDSRIPLWSVDVELPVRNASVELVWVPDKTYNDLPEADALYAFTAPELIPSPPENVKTIINEIHRPGNFFGDSDYGARISTFLNGWDLSFSYFYHYSDTPVLFQSLYISAGMPVVTVDPEYKRTHMTGISFSNSFNDFTVRGETAYFSDKYFIADLNSDPDGIAESNEFDYVLGLDWQGPDDTFVSLQVFQSVLPEDPQYVIRDRTESFTTLFMKKAFAYQTTTAQVMWMHNYNKGDGLLRPKGSYEISDNVSVWIGADIFYGSSNGIFGQFDKNDRIVFGAEIEI